MKIGAEAGVGGGLDVPHKETVRKTAHAGIQYLG